MKSVAAVWGAGASRVTAPAIAIRLTVGHIWRQHNSEAGPLLRRSSDPWAAGASLSWERAGRTSSATSPHSLLTRAMVENYASGIGVL